MDCTKKYLQKELSWKGLISIFGDVERDHSILILIVRQQGIRSRLFLGNRMSRRLWKRYCNPGEPRLKEVVGITVREDYVDVRLASGEQQKSRYVVGCDGAHSFVRKCQSNWRFEGCPINLLWAQCDSTLADPRIRTTRAAGFLGSTGITPSLGMRPSDDRVFSPNSGESPPTKVPIYSPCSSGSSPIGQNRRFQVWSPRRSSTNLATDERYVEACHGRYVQ